MTSDAGTRAIEFFGQAREADSSLRDDTAAKGKGLLVYFKLRKLHELWFWGSKRTCNVLHDPARDGLITKIKNLQVREKRQKKHKSKSMTLIRHLSLILLGTKQGFDIYIWHKIFFALRSCCSNGSHHVFGRNLDYLRRSVCGISDFSLCASATATVLVPQLLLRLERNFPGLPAATNGSLAYTVSFGRSEKTFVALTVLRVTDNCCGMLDQCGVMNDCGMTMESVFGSVMEIVYEQMVIG